MNSTAADVARAALRVSVQLTEAQQERVQVRLFTALLVLAMLFDLIDPAVLLLGTPESLVFRVAEATSIGPYAFAHILLGLAVLLLPFLLLQFGVLERRRRGVTQLACLALALSGLLWSFLAWRAIPLDYGTAPLVFGRAGGGAMIFALALAWSLNADQVRKYREWT